MPREVAARNDLELDALNGTVVRHGRAAGVPIPVHRTTYTLPLPALSPREGE